MIKGKDTSVRFAGLFYPKKRTTIENSVALDLFYFNSLDTSPVLKKNSLKKNLCEA
jgi:hypothetical protein